MVDRVETFDFPDEYFEELGRLESGSGKYQDVLGDFYEAAVSDCRLDRVDVVAVYRRLYSGDVDGAEDFAYDLLED